MLQAWGFKPKVGSGPSRGDGGGRDALTWWVQKEMWWPWILLIHGPLVTGSRLGPTDPGGQKRGLYKGSESGTTQESGSRWWLCRHAWLRVEWKVPP